MIELGSEYLVLDIYVFNFLKKDIPMWNKMKVRIIIKLKFKYLEPGTMCGKVIIVFVTDCFHNLYTIKLSTKCLFIWWTL